MENEIVKMRLTHLGEIGFRLALFGLITAAVITVGSIFSMLIFALVALIGFVLPIITLGLPLMADPNYYGNLTKLLENSSSVFDFFWSLTYYAQFIAIAGIVGSIIGSVCLLSDKNNRNWGKFIFCLISAIVCIFLIVLIATNSFAKIG